MQGNNLATMMPEIPSIAPVTDNRILSYLRYALKFSDTVSAVERDTIILSLCEQLGIVVSDEELQAAGDIFRQKNNLSASSETFAWLETQHITVEDWTKGIRIDLLVEKLKEHLFGEIADSQYMSNRNAFKRIAISQILVYDLGEAIEILQALKEEKASFCALALEHSKGQKSQENGGFVGVRLLAELLPKLSEAVREAEEGEIIGPIQTELGYHILRVEKWFAAELTSVKDRILEFNFNTWLDRNISLLQEKKKVAVE